MEPFEVDVVIIGGGIAGLSAAIYTARHGLYTYIIALDVGGQLGYAGVIENYPGMLRISGRRLVEKVLKQAQEFGAEVFFDEATGLRKEKDGSWIVETKKGMAFRAHAVILASGKTPRKLGVSGEEEYSGKGVSYCTICDAPLFKGRRVVLVSFGIKAVESLELLGPLAKELHYVTQERELRSERLRRLVEEYNVKVHFGSKVFKIKGNGKKVTHVILDTPEGTKTLEADGIFVETGFTTKVDFLREYVELTPKNEVVVDQFGRTKTEGLFAAGDLVQAPYKQAVIAAASGVVAGLSAINYVFKRKGVKRKVAVDWYKKG